MDKSREVKEKNRLRDWRRQNHDEAKEIATQVEKSKKILIHAKRSTTQKGLKTIFSPSNNCQVLHPIEEEIEIIIAQTTTKETNGSPSEDTQQSTEIRTPNKVQKRDERNVDTLLRTPKTTINIVFKTLDWVMEEGWLQIPRKQYEKYVIKEASSSNVDDKAFGRELFKLFLQSPERIKTIIPLNPPPTTITLVMNLPPIMVVPLANALHI